MVTWPIARTPILKVMLTFRSTKIAAMGLASVDQEED